MKVQRIQLTDGKRSWLVIGSDFLPVEPVRVYLRYLENLERSPNTVHAYACHLKLYWQFLSDSQLTWSTVTLEHLADFISWLRQPNPKLPSVHVQTAKRTERTINTILSAIGAFYEYHRRLGTVEEMAWYGSKSVPSRRYKPFLHHLSQGKPIQVKLLKLKEPKLMPQTLRPEQVQCLIGTCLLLRDKFLLMLLYETGMRIGQALGLRHEDIKSWDNEIWMMPRTDNVNGARSKTKETHVVHVSKELMGVYAEYLTDEYPSDFPSDYVFVNLVKGKIGHPLTQSTVTGLFRRLSRTTGIAVHPHLFRHTHATELIRSGWNLAQVQKRLGHSSVQTTINTYTHLTDEDLKQAFQAHLAKEGGKE